MLNVLMVSAQVVFKACLCSYFVSTKKEAMCSKLRGVLNLLIILDVFIR